MAIKRTKKIEKYLSLMDDIKIFLEETNTPTGTVFSKRHKEYFKEPRLMDNIAKELFGGDFWEAYHFQNDALNAGLIKIVNVVIEYGTCKVTNIHLVNSNWEPKG